ncbi:MAG TPA: hypothetical protein VIY48_04770, partial [Candidatus Paceibacterota bacterium]
VPNPEAQIKQGQSDMISQIMGGTPEIPDLASAVMGPGGVVGKTPAVPGADTGAGRFLLSTGKIPTKLDLAEVNAKTAQADLQGATATAQLPEAAATGVAGQQAAQDQTFNDIADRVVEDLYNTTHQIPSPQAAYSFGQRDPRAQAFGPRINEPYYGRAVQRLQDKLAAQRAAALRAAAAYSSGPQDRTVRDIATQQTQLRSQIAARLSENSKLMGQLSTLARYGTPSEFDKKILSQIAANEEANKQDQTTLDGLTNQAGEVIGTTPKVTTNAPKSGRTAMTRIEWRRRRDAILAHPNDPRVKGKTVEQLIGPEPTQ